MQSMNFRQLTYGVLSFVPGIPDSIYRGTGGTGSAEYCYCTWLRHLVLANSAGMESVPRVVAELGPGDSIGVGIAALLSGVERYVALDAMAHADPAHAAGILDALVALFRRRAPIPGRDVFPEIAFDLPDQAFPTAILSESRLQAALTNERIAHLRSVVTGERADPQIIDYRAPWGALREGDAGTVDLLLSNAVMEHVTDLPEAYRAMAAWLRPGGVASNQIDFRSHGLFGTWDGHWACPDWLWRLFVGRRLYLLNREPFSTHRTWASAAGLEELVATRIERAPEAGQLARRFQAMSAADRTTCGGYLVLRKGHLRPCSDDTSLA
jgi:hypothetical protein